MVQRVSARAATDLDRIWDYLCEESGSEAIADRQIDAITERFSLLATHPYAGRARDDDLAGCGKTRMGSLFAGGGGR
jgi:plasmid stabilization system protein ParE